MKSNEAYTIVAEEVRSFVERLERLEEQKKDIMEDQKMVLLEAKNKGFEPKILRKIVSLRKKDADDIATEEALLETYKRAIGM